MIYLAILLILTGLLIILVTLFAETRKVSAHMENLSVEKSASESGISSGMALFPDPEDLDIDQPDYSIDLNENYNFHDEEEDIFVSFDDSDDSIDSYFDNQESDGIDDSHYFDDLNNMETGTADSDDFFSDDADYSNSSEAVMFEDSSGVIDYDSGEGVIDPGMSGYKKIKRIGQGELRLDMDGLNFYVDGRLYRFDFHRIGTIRTGENYLAIPLKGGTAFRLFIFEKGNAFIHSVSDYFYKSKQE